MPVHFRFCLYILLTLIFSPTCSIFSGWVIVTLLDQHSIHPVGVILLLAVFIIQFVFYWLGVKLYPFSERFIGKVTDNIENRKIIILSIPVLIMISMVIVTLIFGYRAVEREPFTHSLPSIFLFALIHFYLWKNWGELLRKPNE